MGYHENYLVWANEADLDASLKGEVAALANDAEAQEEAFAVPMAFGTAGMRGVIGAGINRMNIYTVRQATEGLANFMDTLPAETKAKGVAISFDSRYMSQEFGQEAASVLGAHGIPSFLFDALRPTPELSFAVRHLGTYAGIMITASHNPKQYNGYKIYGQMAAKCHQKNLTRSRNMCATLMTFSTSRPWMSMNFVPRSY